MPIDQNELQAAIELMDAKDDSVWGPDGSPKLDVVQHLTNNDTVTAEDLAAFKRPGSAPVAKAAVPLKLANSALAAVADVVKPTEAPQVASPDTAATEPVVFNPKLTIGSQEELNQAASLVEQARAELATLDNDLAKFIEVRDTALRNIDRVTRARNAPLHIIDEFGPRVSHAESVKAIQKQTQDRLAKTKETSALAAQALAASGTNIYPSKLDQSMAMRRRTPEQNANYAAFVHQTSAGKIAERG